MRGVSVLLSCLMLSILVAGLASAQEIPTLKNPCGVVFDVRGQLIVADSGNDRLLVFSPQMRLVKQIGGGSGEPSFKNPHGLTLDSRGRILVADTGNHRIVILDPEGKFLKAFGSEGSEDGQFRSPFGLTTDSKDQIIVTDTWNHRLQWFDSEGKFLKKYGEHGEAQLQFNEPAGACIGPGGQLLIANGWNSRIDRYDYNPDTLAIRHQGEGETDREKDQGFIWDFWVCGDVKIDAEQRIYGLNRNNGIVHVYNPDGSRLLNAQDQPVTFGGGVYGRFRGPSAIAIRDDTIAIADAGNDRVVVMKTDFATMRRPEVVDIGTDRATIRWTSLGEGAGSVVYRALVSPQDSLLPKDQQPSTDVKRLDLAYHGTKHEAVLTGLRPATAYRFRVSEPGVTIIPTGSFGREYQFATDPPLGRVTFVRLPMFVLVHANVINWGENGKPADAPEPPPVTRADLDKVREEIEKAAIFNWCNSRMKLWMDNEIHWVFDFRDATPEKGRQSGTYTPGPGVDEGADFTRILAQMGKKGTDYAGFVGIQMIRNWDPQKHQFRFQPSGGGTYGADLTGYGQSRFLNGGDTAWLYVHEVGHQIDSFYGESGYDEFLFNHFAPLPGMAAGRFGEHYDGNAWIMRVFPNEWYTRCMFGNLASAEDKDNDGIPDDEPSVPLDEARFGSDPNKVDTDDDGLSDMGEVLASTWCWEMLQSGTSNSRAVYLEPNPRDTDTDDDGYLDGQDPYPLYPMPNLLHQRTPTLDGNLADGEWTSFGHVRIDPTQGTFEGDVYLAWDSGNLYFGFTFPQWLPRFYFQVDAQNDGWYVNNGNYQVSVALDADGNASLADFVINNSILSKEHTWPWNDKESVPKEDIKVTGKKAGGAYHVEVAIPRNEKMGVAPAPNYVFGFAAYFLTEDQTDKWISLFHPYELFQVTCIE